MRNETEDYQLTLWEAETLLRNLRHTIDRFFECQGLCFDRIQTQEGEDLSWEPSTPEALNELLKDCYLEATTSKVDLHEWLVELPASLEAFLLLEGPEGYFLHFVAQIFRFIRAIAYSGIKQGSFMECEGTTGKSFVWMENKCLTYVNYDKLKALIIQVEDALSQEIVRLTKEAFKTVDEGLEAMIPVFSDPKTIISLEPKQRGDTSSPTKALIRLAHPKGEKDSLEFEPLAFWEAYRQLLEPKSSLEFGFFVHDRNKRSFKQDMERLSRLMIQMARKKVESMPDRDENLVWVWFDENNQADSIGPELAAFLCTHWQKLLHKTEEAYRKRLSWRRKNLDEIR